jgi:flagellar biogenesis protein FliO
MISPTCFKTRPRRESPFWAFLALGVWLFWGGAVTHSWAVDANSAIFQQGATAVSVAPNKSVSSSDAANPLALPEEQPQPAPGFWYTLFRLLAALLLTIGLIVLCVWGLKVFWGKQGWENKQSADHRPLKILASAHLAPRKQVHLIEVGKRILVVGSGKDEVTSLGVIQDPEEMEMIRQTARSESGFTDILRRAWSRQESGKTREETSQLAKDGREAIGGWVDKLRDLSKKSKSGPGTGGGGE